VFSEKPQVLSGGEPAWPAQTARAAELRVAA
jgi:hypothetical protein